MAAATSSTSSKHSERSLNFCQSTPCPVNKAYLSFAAHLRLHAFSSLRSRCYPLQTFFSSPCTVRQRPHPSFALFVTRRADRLFPTRFWTVSRFKIVGSAGSRTAQLGSHDCNSICTRLGPADCLPSCHSRTLSLPPRLPLYGAPPFSSRIVPKLPARTIMFQK